MDAFFNSIKSLSSQLDQGWAHPRLAIVTSVDGATYTARVTVQPENVLTGWLPVLALWSGQGWGVTAAPAPGDQVVVIWQEGDAEQGIILGRICSQSSVTANAPIGEFWITHASGTCIKLRNDGSIESSGGTWFHQGSLVVSGDVSDGEGKLSALRGDYNQHVHPPSSATAVPQA